MAALHNPILGNNNPIDQQNLRLMQQQGMNVPGQTNTKQQQVQQLNELLDEEKAQSAINYAEACTNRYSNYLHQLKQLNPDSFSITKAVYLSEAAYYDKTLSLADFTKAIKQRTSIVKQYLKRQGLDGNNSFAANYAIQKLYSQAIKFTDNKTGATYTSIPPKYDFNDYNGDTSWTKMFVTKLLQTNSGQCHSMPLLYLCMAEQLHAKAYLSFAPNHSYIQFFDDKGTRYNFETTNGNLVSQAWLMQSTLINATAIKNKTYLDTLSSRQLYAQCLSDLMMGYIAKVGYNTFSQQLAAEVLAIDPHNITAIMAQSNYNTCAFNRLAQQYGYPPKSAIPNYPALNAAYQKMLDGYKQVDATGYQPMPAEVYAQWLKSVQQDKQRQENKQMTDNRDKLIENLKKFRAAQNKIQKQ